MLDFFKIIIYKVWGAGVLIFSVVLLLAMLTFSVSDPSMLNVSSGKVHNIMGAYGAYFIDPLLQTFGYGLTLPILFCLIWGIKLLLGKKDSVLLLRIALLLITMPVFSGLLSSLAATFPAVGNGGFVGLYVKNELAWRLQLESILPLLACLSLTCGILALNLSWQEWKHFIVFLSITLKKTLVYAKNILTALYYFLKRIRAKLQAEEGLNSSFQCSEGVDSSDAEGGRLQSSSFEEVEESYLSESTSIIATVGGKKRKSRPLRRPKEEVDSQPAEEGLLIPITNLLNPVVPAQNKQQVTTEALENNAQMLRQVLQDFGVKGEVTNIYPGPVVTLYELEPSAGTKSSRVINLADDIARSMSSISARIAVIPGKNAIGIELPNLKREMVYLRALLEGTVYKNSQLALPLILGKNIGGEAVVTDLAKMPHLLVAGTTGSGKSVAINTMILSLLYKHSPKTCRLVMIDPKMLELSVYEGIPHLIAPVVTEPKKAICALRWVVREMEERYRAMSTLGVRNIHGYNSLLSEAIAKGKKLSKQVQVGFDQEMGYPIFETVTIGDEILPYIVVIVDEMADLMLVAGKDIEAYIQRLAQMARAAGIHLIMATQRPSVDVITGVIKANFPTRISFQVTSKIDSRTILGEQGAEQLLGMGDMLYMMPGGRIERVHGPFVDDKEVENVVAFLKKQGGPNYIDEGAFEAMEEGETGSMLAPSTQSDDIYEQAVAIVLKDQKASTSYLQRCLKIGYNRAAVLIERMEKEGVISMANHIGKREILVNKQQ